jgi:hypothetical protein
MPVAVWPTPTPTVGVLSVHVHGKPDNVHAGTATTLGSTSAAGGRSDARLVLHNLHARGRRYDVIVDATGRRMVPLSP